MVDWMHAQRTYLGYVDDVRRRFAPRWYVFVAR